MHPENECEILRAVNKALERSNKVLKARLREAERLLREWSDNYDLEPDCACDRCRALPRTRAFLAARGSGTGRQAKEG